MEYILIILNLIVLESVLSIDNVAVLATMVKHLPQSDQPKALKYGIWGAFIFRGLCLATATLLYKIVWIKIVGGLFLLYLVFKHFFMEDEDSDPKVGAKSFWGTVIAIEFMDLSFSLDNIFAAVALSSNIWVVMIGVFIGIISMRFIAQKFIILMNKYPSMNTSVFYVIFLLGMKLILSGFADYIDYIAPLNVLFSNHYFDIGFSLLTLLIFILPILIENRNTNKIMGEDYH